jgi:hypothetical protein
VPDLTSSHRLGGCRCYCNIPKRWTAARGVDLCAFDIVRAVFLERPRNRRKFLETKDVQTNAGWLSDKPECAMVRNIDLCGCARDGFRHLPHAVVHLHQSLGIVDHFGRTVILESKTSARVTSGDALTGQKISARPAEADITTSFGRMGFALLYPSFRTDRAKARPALARALPFAQRVR